MINLYHWVFDSHNVRLQCHRHDPRLAYDLRNDDSFPFSFTMLDEREMTNSNVKNFPTDRTAESASNLSTRNRYERKFRVNGKTFTTVPT